MEHGRLHIYHGDGKGKTTAAMGLCLRAAGQGLEVGVAQFLKDGMSGECAALQGIPHVRLFPFLPRVPFPCAMSPDAREQAAGFYAALLDRCRAAAPSLDLLVLDEVLDAVGTRILPEEALLRFVRERPEGLELILTGRDPAPALLEAADYITEMRAVRHPYQQGVTARRGIEW